MRVDGEEEGQGGVVEIVKDGPAQQYVRCQWLTPFAPLLRIYLARLCVPFGLHTQTTKSRSLISPVDQVHDHTREYVLFFRSAFGDKKRHTLAAKPDS